MGLFDSVRKTLTPFVTFVDSKFSLCCNNIEYPVHKIGDITNMATKTKKTVEKLEKTLNAPDVVETLDQLEVLISKVHKAQRIFATYPQEKVDAIFKAAAAAADKARIPLARMAVEETGMGVLEDKIIKNHFASEYIYNKHKHAKTCGIIKEDKANGIKIVAEPLGVLAGIVPTTNPTSTAIFKSLISLKTRNGIIF